MLAHAVLHLTSLPELQRLGKSTGVNLSVEKSFGKKDRIRTPLFFCTQMLQHRKRQMAEKPGEASGHTDAWLNKHLAANTEILLCGTLRPGGHAAADCENMCSRGRVGGEGSAKEAVVRMP